MSDPGRDSIVVLVNRLGELRADQTTTRLVQAAARLGHRVHLIDVFGLAVHRPDDIRARAITVEPGSDDSLAAIAAQTASTTSRLVRLDRARLVLVRTSPGRDLAHAWAHRMALHAMRLLSDRGVRVVNDPVGLERASSKLYGACLPPELSPATLVTHEWSSARSWIEQLGRPVVVKPLLGSQGRDVFFLDHADVANAKQIVEVLGRSGYLVVQEYLPEAVEGDVRVLLFDGAILEVDGREAAVRRVPQRGEFRSNVSLGARAEAVSLTPEQLSVSERIAAILARDDIVFAGLDLVGTHAVEVNVYSTGGLTDMELFYGLDYATPVLTGLLA